ncbi:MAG: isochorismatase family protein, partial [Candidatus Omnitrophica bacterium]|nr:isochorismatase family protein [Candidatus Omnitrophota bacterium]
MRKTLFFDVDTQYDFMYPQGKLYVRGAENIIPNLNTLTKFADKSKITIVSSLDAHIKNDPEFRQFPQHCVAHTKGQRKISQTIARHTKQIIIKKCTFDVFSNPKAKRI